MEAASFAVLVHANRHSCWHCRTPAGKLTCPMCSASLAAWQTQHRTPAPSHATLPPRPCRPPAGRRCQPGLPGRRCCHPLPRPSHPRRPGAGTPPACSSIWMGCRPDQVRAAEGSARRLPERKAASGARSQLANSPYLQASNSQESCLAPVALQLVHWMGKAVPHHLRFSRGSRTAGAQQQKQPEPGMHGRGAGPGGTLHAAGTAATHADCCFHAALYCPVPSRYATLCPLLRTSSRLLPSCAWNTSCASLSLARMLPTGCAASCRAAAGARALSACVLPAVGVAGWRAAATTAATMSSKSMHPRYAVRCSSANSGAATCGRGAGWHRGAQASVGAWHQRHARSYVPWGRLGAPLTRPAQAKRRSSWPTVSAAVTDMTARGGRVAR